MLFDVCCVSFMVCWLLVVVFVSCFSLTYYLLLLVMCSYLFRVVCCLSFVVCCSFLVARC